MKKILLFALALGIGASSMAQQSYKFKIDTKEQKKIEAPAIGIEPIKSASVTKSDIKSEIITPADRDINIVNIIDIGTSANAYGYANGAKSIVWVDTELNTVTNFHRMGGDLDPDGYSGDLGYDISFDGGDTWTNMVECYVATENSGGEYFTDAARYPNHGLFNPTGNVDDAFVMFFAPNLDQSNSADSWGGYSYGVSDISDPAVTTKNLLSSHDDYYQYVPDSYELTTLGDAWVIDINQDWGSGSVEYQSSLIMNHSVWNGTDFELTQSLMDFDIIDQENQGRPAFVQVAFGDDGLTGYIVALANDGSAEAIGGGSNLYPIYWKTTDGGDNWEGPNFIQLDGPNGIGGIVYNHLTDQAIEELFEPPVPAREDISYTTAFDMNIAVTVGGNLHIAIIIGPTGSDAYSIVTAKGYIAALDIFTNDGGTTWFAEEMGRVATFRGNFGDLTEDNRIQITTNKIGDKVFVSWLDTDIEDAEDNDRPNIWCRGFEPATYMKTADGSGNDAPTNVTLFSAGMWQAYYFAAPKWCFSGDGSYVIPFTYQEMDPADAGVPVQFKYLTNFSYSEADFSVQGINDPVEVVNSLGSVSQNFPNPFNNESYVTVNLTEGSNLSLEVYTLTGQMVSAKDYGYRSNGSHTLTINGADLTSGIYFYTVTAGQNKVTHKMIVD